MFPPEVSECLFNSANFVWGDPLIKNISYNYKINETNKFPYDVKIHCKDLKGQLARQKAEFQRLYPNERVRSLGVRSLISRYFGYETIVES